MKEKEGLELLRMEVIPSLKNRESCGLLFSGNYKKNLGNRSKRFSGYAKRYVRLNELTTNIEQRRLESVDGLYK